MTIVKESQNNSQDPQTEDKSLWTISPGDIMAIGLVEILVAGKGKGHNIKMAAELALRSKLTVDRE